MKPIEFSCLLLSGVAMVGSLIVGTLSSSAHAASPAKATPAKEAIEVCQGKKEGDVVQLPMGNGKTAKAVCRSDGSKLIARRGASVGP